jgi:hypothetical protein
LCCGFTTGGDTFDEDTMTDFVILAGIGDIHHVIAGAAIIALAVLVGLEIASTLWSGGSARLLHCVALLAGLALVAAVLAALPQLTIVGKVLSALSVGFASAAAVTALMILRKPAETAPAPASAPTPETEAP